MSEVKDWEYRCTNCGELVVAGRDFGEACPKCHHRGWICHWKKMDELPRKFLKNHFIENNSEPKPTEAYKNTDGQFCPPKNNAVVAISKVDKITEVPPKEQSKPGRKSVTVPDDLIRQLSTEGLGAKRIAEKLNEQGVSVSYKTIQRRLQGSLL